MQNGRRIKLALIVVVLLGSALTLLAWTQVWGYVEVSLAGSVQERIEVTGATAAPALTALALAGFALAGALTIAGRFIRIILGLLEILLGVSVVLSAFIAVSNPAAASAAAVTAATGIAGTDSILNSVVDEVTTVWPFVALAAAAVMVVAGIAILVTAKRWPGATTRYKSTRFEPTGSTNTGVEGASDAIGDWDDLSRGQDPTVLPGRDNSRTGGPIDLNRTSTHKGER